MYTFRRKPFLIIVSVVASLATLSLFGCTGLSRIEVGTRLNFPETRGPWPMAHQTIYLLSSSIASPEMEEAFKKHMASASPPSKPSQSVKQSEIRTRAGFMLTEGKAIWRKYVVENAETDWEGKVTFRKVSPGDYWIYCITKKPFSDEWLLWNVKTTVNFYDTTKVSLTNENISFTH